MKKSHVFAAYILMAAATVLPGCRSTSAAGAAGDGKNVSKNISKNVTHREHMGIEMKNAATSGRYIAWAAVRCRKARPREICLLPAVMSMR